MYQIQTSQCHCRDSKQAHAEYKATLERYRYTSLFFNLTYQTEQRKGKNTLNFPQDMQDKRTVYISLEPVKYTNFWLPCFKFRLP
jgi:pyrimidine deaminase RibD-like protein